jgi:predicted GTPase
VNESQHLRPELQQATDEVSHIAVELQRPDVALRLIAFRDDCANDLYTIVVLGEFNRGKSSLINSLLRTDVLPMDVTPTTAAINVIRFDDKRRIRVQLSDGKSEDLPFSPESLGRFTGNANTDDIRYIEIGMPHSLLRDGTVIVDTPGVDDLDNHRVEITYNFIPRSDAVLFVLSALSALNRSEIDFLQNAVLKKGIDRILFVVNYMDSLDEGEREEFLRTLTNRIRRAIPSYSGRVYPVSARSALRAINSGDGRGLEEIVDLEKAIEALRQTRGIDKIRRHKHRLSSIIETFVEELTASMAVMQTTNEELNTQLEALQDSLLKGGDRAERMHLWLTERQREAELMISKSVDGLEESLQAELKEVIAGYSGPEFDKYLSSQVPRLAKARLKQWVELHGDPLSALLHSISDEMADSLSRTFNIMVEPIRRTTDWAGITEISFSLPSIKVPNAMYRAGLIGGTAAGLLGLLGAPVVVPLICMVGLPVMRDKLHEYNLAKARPVAELLVQEAVHEAAGNLRNAVSSAFLLDLNLIGSLAEKRFNDLAAGLRKEVESEIARRTEQRAGGAAGSAALSDAIAKLNEIREHLMAPDSTGVSFHTTTTPAATLGA